MASPACGFSDRQVESTPSLASASRRSEQVFQQKMHWQDYDNRQHCHFEGKIGEWRQHLLRLCSWTKDPVDVLTEIGRDIGCDERRPGQDSLKEKRGGSAKWKSEMARSSS